MNTLSRLHTIDPPEGAEGPRRVRAVRVVVGPGNGTQSRVVLAPGDRLIVENRTGLTLRVAPLDFFGTAFDRHVLETGESTPPLAVGGLWFQVELSVNGRRFYPLDVYLAPNGVT
jgi:hypothetical protein